MSSSIHAVTTHNSCSFFASVSATIKKWCEDIHEFFTHHKAILQKIDGLRQRLLSQQSFELNDPEKLNSAMFGLRRLLEDNAHFQNKKLVRSPRIKAVYDQFNQELESLRQQVLAQKVEQWKSSYLPLEPNQVRQKESLLRWMDSTPAQRRFAAYYNVEIPYKFSEIPAGSILLTDPYAYLKHMDIEGKLPIGKAILLNIKSLVCRLATGKQFTHVEYAMGGGKTFDLDKRKTEFCHGDGNIVDKGDHVFYGMVLAPKEHDILQDHNERFTINKEYYKNAGSRNFAELSQKINNEIGKATSAKAVSLTSWDILKTLFTKKRPATYDPIREWKDGACHYSCSGTTAALLERFGVRISEQFNKKVENITPTDFYHSRYFTPWYVLDSLDVKGRP